MATNHIVVTRAPPGPAIDVLATAGDVWVWPEDRTIDRAVLLDRASTADAMYTMLTERIDTELLDAAPKLRVVSNMAVGTDNIDIAACTARGVLVGHTPGVLAETVADTAVGLLLMGARRLVEAVDYVRDGRWGPWDPGLLWGQDVHTSTVGIIGMGGVGQAIGRRLKGFGCELLFWNRSVRADVASDLEAQQVGLDDLFRRSDHVIVAVALTDETKHIVDGQALAAMKPTATLVNVARGGAVDQAALTSALLTGSIAGAALDVTDPEPPLVDDPLLRLPNCVVIPHLGSSSERTRVAMAVMAAENVVAGLRGSELLASPNQQQM